MSATLLLVLSCLVSFGCVVGASAAARWAGTTLDLGVAAIAFALATLAAGLAGRAFAQKPSPWRVAPLVGPGIAAVALGFGAFQSGSDGVALLGAFAFGVALCLYGLMNDLDQQVKPTLIMASVMIELMAIGFLVR